jgi:hypothetical protein
MESLWWSRLQWRFRGAWMWPSFVGATLGEALLLHERPIAGDSTGLFGGLLLAAFFNLVGVAIVAPLTGRLLRGRRRDLPRLVANDYAGTAVIVVIAVALVAGGLAHRPAVLAAKRAFAAQAAAAHDYVMSQAPAAYRRNFARADTIRLTPGLYRTCVPGPGGRRALCLFVDTTQSPAGVRRDGSAAPNSSYLPYRDSSR